MSDSDVSEMFGDTGCEESTNTIKEEHQLDQEDSHKDESQSGADGETDEQDKSVFSVFKKMIRPVPKQGSKQPKGPKTKGDEPSIFTVPDCNPKRGYAILVINEKFQNGLPRSGANRDVEHLKSVFIDRLGFTWFNKDKHMNLTTRDMTDILERARQHDHTGNSYFVFAISTHGCAQPKSPGSAKLEQALLFFDGEIFLSDIMNSFSDQNALTMKDVRRIFIIQACRVEKNNKDPNETVDSGVSVGRILSRPQPPSPEKMSGEAGDQPDLSTTQNVPDQPGSFQPYKHSLIMYAVPPKKFAFRRETEGSWMLHSLREALKDFPTEVPLLRLLTRTCQIMSEKVVKAKGKLWHNKKAVAYIQHRLLENILFN